MNRDGAHRCGSIWLRLAPEPIVCSERCGSGLRGKPRRSCGHTSRKRRTIQGSEGRQYQRKRLNGVHWLLLRDDASADPAPASSWSGSGPLAEPRKRSCSSLGMEREEIRSFLAIKVALAAVLWPTIWRCAECTVQKLRSKASLQRTGAVQGSVLAVTGPQLISRKTVRTHR